MDAKEILKKLVGFNTIKDKENKEIMDFIENYLKGFGFKTEYKSKCLVMSNSDICEIGFLGHTDTVSCSDDWKYDPFDLTEVDEKLYGLGACDMKGGIAAILSAVEKIDFSKLKKGIRLFFTYDEEIGFKGVNELVEKNTLFPKYMIFGEPTNNQEIKASKGLLEFKINFKGVSSHSSSPEEGVNAIERCVDFIVRLKKFYAKLKEEKINSKFATMNIGVINGGRSVNIVPNSCELMIDFRTISKKQNKEIIKEIKGLIADDDSCVIINDIEPFSGSSGNDILSNYITEASFVETEKKCILGAGPNNAHKKDEFITVESLEKLEKQYIYLIKYYCE